MVYPDVSCARQSCHSCFEPIKANYSQNQEMHGTTLYLAVYPKLCVQSLVITEQNVQVFVFKEKPSSLDLKLLELKAKQIIFGKRFWEL
jgi:hypothetical protein